MREKQKIINYPSKNIKTETYKFGDTFVTKNYYDAKDAYVREFISEENGVKEVKHFTPKGVLAKLEHFVQDKRHGQEIKYLIAKADKSIKSTKMYDSGKLHGENITYDDNAQVIKHEVYANGKLVLKYLREDNNNDITSVEILSKENVDNLPKIEYEKLSTLKLL
jgi:antitoxin component YwqK of YwqJK toxin-antitoxin module